MGGCIILGFGFALSFKLIKPLHRPRDQQQVIVRPHGVAESNENITRNILTFWRPQMIANSSLASVETYSMNMACSPEASLRWAATAPMQSGALAVGRAPIKATEGFFRASCGFVSDKSMVLAEGVGQTPNSLPCQWPRHGIAACAFLGGLLLGAILTGRAYRAPPAGAQRSEVLNRVLRGGELHGHHQVLPSASARNVPGASSECLRTPPRTSWTLYAATPPRAACKSYACSRTLGLWATAGRARGTAEPDGRGSIRPCRFQGDPCL